MTVLLSTTKPPLLVNTMIQQNQFLSFSKLSIFFRATDCKIPLEFSILYRFYNCELV